ncbi:MAG: rRNA maturation RNase YbeY [Acidobacteriota bacterium]
MPATEGVGVEIVTRLQRLPLSKQRCRRLLQRAARLAPPPGRPRWRGGRGTQLTVLFAGHARMRKLNARFRGVDHPTDVLAFPTGEAEGFHGDYLGDLAIGVPIARRQARLQGHPLAREVEYLLLHGYLHLLGYDHETDQGQMVRLERSLRSRLGLHRGQRVS